MHTFPAESRDIFDEPFRRVELPIEITYSKIVQHSAPEKPKTSGESLKLALSRTEFILSPTTQPRKSDDRWWEEAN